MLQPTFHQGQLQPPLPMPPTLVDTSLPGDLLGDGQRTTVDFPLPLSTPGPGASAVAAQQGLPPFPESPIGFFGGLPYWIKVILARWKRRQVIQSFRREIATEVKKLDEILRDLGKRGRALELDLPALQTEMEGLHGLEGQRASAEEGKEEFVQRIKEEEAKFSAVETDCNERIQEAKERVGGLQGNLNEKGGELRAAKARLAARDKALKALAHQRDARRNAVVKAKDPDKREGLEQAAAELAVELGDAEKEREALAGEVGALEGPIAELTTTLTEWRGRLLQAQKELATARLALATAKRELGVEERRRGLEVTRLDREITEKLLVIGRVMDGNRMAHSELDELYGRIDESRKSIGQREQQIQQIEGERASFQPEGVRNGKILFFSLLGLVLALILTLVILFVFVFD